MAQISVFSNMAQIFGPFTPLLKPFLPKMRTFLLSFFSTLCHVLIDDANQCPAAVLDRLNALMEPKGTMFLPECGRVDRIVHPHKDFRLILAYNPYSGPEISRAMRNRGVEIYVPEKWSDCDRDVLDFSAVNGMGDQLDDVNSLQLNSIDLNSGTNSLSRVTQSLSTKAKLDNDNPSTPSHFVYPSFTTFNPETIENRELEILNSIQDNVYADNLVNSSLKQDFCEDDSISTGDSVVISGAKNLYLSRLDFSGLEIDSKFKYILTTADYLLSHQLKNDVDHQNMLCFTALNLIKEFKLDPLVSKFYLNEIFKVFKKKIPKSVFTKFLLNTGLDTKSELDFTLAGQFSAYSIKSIEKMCSVDFFRPHVQNLFPEISGMSEDSRELPDALRRDFAEDLVFPVLETEKYTDYHVLKYDNSSIMASFRLVTDAELLISPEKHVKYYKNLNSMKNVIFEHGNFEPECFDSSFRVFMLENFQPENLLLSIPEKSIQKLCIEKMLNFESTEKCPVRRCLLGHDSSSFKYNKSLIHMEPSRLESFLLNDDVKTKMAWVAYCENDKTACMRRVDEFLEDASVTLANSSKYQEFLSQAHSELTRILEVNFDNLNLKLESYDDVGIRKGLVDCGSKLKFGEGLEQMGAWVIEAFCPLPDLDPTEQNSLLQMVATI